MVPFTLSISPACVTWGTSLPDFLQAASAAGFAGAELSIQEAQAWSKESGIDAPRRLFEALDLRPVAWSGLIPSGPVLAESLLVDDETFDRQLASLGGRLELADRLNCHIATMVVNPYSAMPKREAWAKATRRLETLGNRCAEHNIDIALEFISALPLPGSAGHPEHPFLSSFHELEALIAALAVDNVGILLDTFHAYISGELSILTPTQLQLVKHVQISDAPTAPNRARLDDSMRLLPGDGAAPLVTTLSQLHAAGYQGAVSVELFSESLWAVDPRAAAADCFTAIHGLSARTPA